MKPKVNEAKNAGDVSDEKEAHSDTSGCESDGGIVLCRHYVPTDEQASEQDQSVNAAQNPRELPSEIETNPGVEALQWERVKGQMHLTRGNFGLHLYNRKGDFDTAWEATINEVLARLNAYEALESQNAALLKVRELAQAVLKECFRTTTSGREQFKSESDPRIYGPVVEVLRAALAAIDVKEGE